jgi:hypothetical protein
VRRAAQQYGNHAKAADTRRLLCAWASLLILGEFHDDYPAWRAGDAWEGALSRRLRALAGIWYFLYQRRPRLRRPEQLPDARELLARELEQSAETARREGRYEEAQLMQWRSAWLDTKPQLGDDMPPKQLDPDVYQHLTWADAIQRHYGTLLADKSPPFGRCSYKPEALLPFPKVYIADALRMLLDVGEGRVTSRHVSAGALSSEVLDSINEGLRRLDRFLDVTPDDIPTDPEENESYGARYRGSHG